MDTNDAIETARAFPDAVIVPIHTDGWAHFRQNAADLRATFDTLGFGKRLRILEPGVATVIEPCRGTLILRSALARSRRMRSWLHDLSRPSGAARHEALCRRDPGSQSFRNTIDAIQPDISAMNATASP